MRKYNSNDLDTEVYRAEDVDAALADAQEELAWSMNREHDLNRVWIAAEKHVAHCVTVIKGLEPAIAAETKRREEAEACPVCSGTGEKSTDGRPCACNGSGKWYETYLTLQREVAAKDAKLWEKENQIVECRAIIESIALLVTRGIEPSDFMMSFFLVREVWDVVQNAAAKDKRIAGLDAIVSGYQATAEDITRRLHREEDKVAEIEAERDKWKATASHEADGLESWKKEAEKLTAERDRLREAAIMAHRVLLQMNDHEDYTIRTINDLAAAIAQDAIGKEGK